MIQLVIFDCDGVLVDSEVLANQVFCQALQKLGLPYDFERTVEAFMGRSLKSGFAQIESELGHALPENFAAQLDAETFAAFATSLQPVPGITAALAQIQSAYKTCIASSGGYDKMQVTLAKTQLAPLFTDRIYSAVDVKNGKPAPDLFLHAAEKMGVAPKDCLVIEDSPFGVQAAVSAGMRVFGYAAMTPSEKLNAQGATLTFTDMHQLPALIAAI